MKVILLYVAIFALILLTVPMIALNYDLDVSPGIPVHNPAPRETSERPEPTAAAQQTQGVPETDDEEPADEDVPADLEPPLAERTDKGVDSFLMLDESTGAVTEVSLRDFVRGAVAAEMPASFHSEALKAQAVAAHTFALHNHRVQQENPDPELKGADFSADPQNFKVYMTEQDARDFYGDNADLYWKKICDAADSVLPYVMEYDSEPIVAAYHAISAGQTEDATNVWIGSAPYLQPAESAGDYLAPGYETTVWVPTDDMWDLLTKTYPDIELEADPAGWFSQPVTSESGYVLEIAVGNQVLHGKEIRELLDLRSHNFDLSYSDTGFTFRVYGYGHGVGLSQYGADYLARQGKSFDEILEHYYTGVTLRRVAVEDGAD